MTNREFFSAISELNIDSELVDFAKSEIAKLDARNAKRRDTLSKEQKANEAVKAEMLNVISTNTMVASEIAKAMELSTQKVSALCRQLVADGALIASDVKVKGKGTVKAYHIPTDADVLETEEA